MATARVSETSNQVVTAPEVILTSSVSFLLLPNEILEVILLEASEFHSANWHSAQARLIHDLHILSAICRRSRQILLPRIYHSVRLAHCGSDRSRLQFLHLVPFHGHFCQTLALHILGTGARFCDLVGLLYQHCKHLTNLRVLELAVHLSDENPTGKHYWGYCLMEAPNPATMGVKELGHWKNLCAALPRVTKLHLHGFAWFDATAGFPETHLSTVRTLILQLAASTHRWILPTARAFNLAFPSLVDITFPPHWCPNVAWVRTAFANRQLENIAIISPWKNQLHTCFFCSWAASIEFLLQLSAASLISLSISSDICLQLSRERTALPCLTSLIVDDVNFDDSEELFLDVMEPFLRSPLQHLGLDNCKDVPESFCTWFEPKLNQWPTLKTLSLESLETTCGPGDEEWDEADPAEREWWDRPDDDNDDVYWRSRTRITLEEYCVQRGIQFVSDWYWFEGYG